METKKVCYITYDRYEHDEWYYIYHMSRSKSEIMKTLKQDLKSFICYGPDDCHSFQCQRVYLTDNEYQYLLSIKGETDTDELLNIMIPIYDNSDPWGPDTLLFTDGCTDICDLVKYYYDHYYKGDEDFDDVEQDLVDELYYSDDEELLNKVLDEYLTDTYGL